MTLISSKWPFGLYPVQSARHVWKTHPSFFFFFLVEVVLDRMQGPVLFLFRKENTSFIAPAKIRSHSSRADCTLSRGTRCSSHMADVSSVVSGQYQCHIEAWGSLAGKAGPDKPFCLLLGLLVSVPCCRTGRHVFPGQHR